MRIILSTCCPPGNSSTHDDAKHSLRAVARLADAAKEGNKLIEKTGEAASSVLRSAAAMDNLALDLDATLDLSQVRAAYAPVASQFKLNEPELLAAHRFVLQTQREYLRGFARP